MKKFKAILALVLVAALFVTLFAACASNNEKPNTDKPADTNTNKPTDTDKPADNGDADVVPEEMLDLSFWFYGDVEGYEAVEAAVNEITEREINVHVDFTVMAMGEYMQQLNMALGSGERVDVFARSFGPTSFATLFSNNMLMDLAPYLDEYAPELKELCGNLLDSFQFNGGIYAIPPYRVLNSTLYIGMREDILKEIGMYDFAKNMTSWSEYEQIMQKVKDTYTADGMYASVLVGHTMGVITGNDSFANAKLIDYCGDTMRLVCGFDDGHVEALYWNEEQIQQFERYADWMAKGYVWPDSPYANEDAVTIIKNGVAFSELFVSEIGIEATKKANTGFDYLCVPVKETPVTTDQVTKFGLGVSSICEEPEAAMKFINLMYTNKDLANLLVFGVEGKNYQLTSDGLADYPVAGESGSTDYHLNEYQFGNQFLLHPWTGNAADFRETSLELFKSAPLSPYMGFSLNLEGMNDKVAVLSTVNERYFKLLTSGAYTPELLKEFQDALTAAGMDDYLAEVQKQVSAWLAGK